MHGYILRSTAAAAALATALGTTGTARAAEGESAAHNFYLRYCGACHGPEGRGDGVVSSLMTPHPADLTKIASKQGGQFSFTATMRAIDGTATLRAHGDPDMPVWGEVWREQAGATPIAQAEVRGKLMLITEYLRSIQDPPAADAK